MGSEVESGSFGEQVEIGTQLPVDLLVEEGSGVVRQPVGVPVLLFQCRPCWLFCWPVPLAVPIR